MLRNKDYLHQVLVVKSWKWLIVMPRSFDKLVPLYPQIYTSKTVRDLLMSDHISLDLQLEFIHALEHLYQQKQTGIVIWLGTYFFKHGFRLNQELAAVREELRFLKKHGLHFDFDALAEKLIHKGPLKLLDDTDAKAQLLNMWQQL